MDPGSGRSTRLDPERLHATLWQSQVLVAKAHQAIARARLARHEARRDRAQRNESDDSALARLAAKQGTMPVIEQAKGIIMAQRRCRPEEAFDLLRRASQRANIKVHVLATQLVEQIAASDEGGTVTPITLGAARSLRPGTRGGDRLGEADQATRSAMA